MCGSSAPPAPKPDPAIAKSLEASTKLGKEYLAFSKEQFAVSQERQSTIDALTKEISTYFLDIAKGDKERYDTVFKPLEDEFIKTAREFDSPERQAEAAAKAGADVQSAAVRERGAIDRSQFSMGVRPDAGRYGGLDRAMGLGTALGSVDAQNKARDAIRDKGLALKGDAINLGRGTQATAHQAGAAAANPQLAANAQWMQTPGIVAGGYNAAQQGYQAQAQGLGNLYGTQANIYNTDARLAAANAAGTGQFLGTVAGTGLSFLSDEDAKTNRKKVPAGKALDAVENMGVDEFNYKPGVADGGEQRHIGPMAEEFAEATGKGDGTTISVQDALGTAMGAIKDLSKKVDRLAEVIGLGAKPQAAHA